MDLKKTVLMSCASLAVCLCAAASAAQQEPPQRAGRAGAGNAPVLTPVELERWFDSYVLIQAQEAVKVTDAQFPRFLQRLKALQAVKRRNAAARRQLLNTLGRIVNASPVDEAALKDRLRALRDLDARAADEVRQAYDGLDEVLDAAQQARFRLFEQMVERRQIDLLMRARARAGGPGRQAPTPIP